MSKEEKNIFQIYDYYATLFDGKGKPLEVKVTDLSEEDFRRWLMWKLPRLVRRGPREPPVAKPKAKKTTKKTTKKTKKTQTPAPSTRNVE